MIKALLGILGIFLGVFSSPALEQGQTNSARRARSRQAIQCAVASTRGVQAPRSIRKNSRSRPTSLLSCPQPSHRRSRRSHKGNCQKICQTSWKRIEKLAKHLRGEIYA